jgi:hypothetical protein
VAETMTELSPTDKAVKYLLDAVQQDPDLAHVMLHTQGHALLIEAEAVRLGEPVEAVEARRTQDRQPAYRRRLARVVEDVVRG